MSNLCIIERLDLTFLKRLSNCELPVLYAMNKYVPQYNACGVDNVLSRFVYEIKNMYGHMMPILNEYDYTQIEYDAFLFDLLGDSTKLRLSGVPVEAVNIIQSGVSLDMLTYYSNNLSDIAKSLVDLCITIHSYTDVNELIAYLLQKAGCKKTVQLLKWLCLDSTEEYIDLSNIMYFESLDLAYKLNLVSLYLWQENTGRNITISGSLYDIAYHSGMLHS